MADKVTGSCHILDLGGVRKSLIFLESTGWIAACAGVPSGSFFRYFCMIGEAFS